MPEDSLYWLVLKSLIIPLFIVILVSWGLLRYQNCSYLKAIEEYYSVESDQTEIVDSSSTQESEHTSDSIEKFLKYFVALCKGICAAIATVLAALVVYFTYNYFKNFVDLIRVNANDSGDEKYIQELCTDARQCSKYSKICCGVAFILVALVFV